MTAAYNAGLRDGFRGILDDYPAYASAYVSGWIHGYYQKTGKMI